MVPLKDNVVLLHSHQIATRMLHTPCSMHYIAFFGLYFTEYSINIAQELSQDL